MSVYIRSEGTDNVINNLVINDPHQPLKKRSQKHNNDYLDYYLQNYGYLNFTFSDYMIHSLT